MDDAADLGPARAARDRPARGMFAEVAGLPRQLREGYEHARARPRRRVLRDVPGRSRRPSPTGVVVCGMGGSAIGADLVLACLPGLRVPATVVRGYALPEWVGPETLVVVVSYSGETEEALACAAQARSRGCAPVCVDVGRQPRAPSPRREGLPLVRVPGGGQPRAAVGSLSMPLLATLEAAGPVPRARRATSRRPRRSCEADNAHPRPGRAERRRIPPRRSPAASRSAWPWCTAPGPRRPVARRWKGQINENAKAPAFFNELPELDHNELMGWTSLPHVTSSTVAAVPARRAGRGAPGAPRGAHGARVRGARRGHGAGRRARGLAARAALLARAAGRLRVLLPRPAVRRRPHAGRRHPGAQGRASPATPADAGGRRAPSRSS